MATHLIGAGLPLDGVVYLGDADVKMIFEKKGGRAIRLEDSLVPLERRFAFYDQVRARRAPTSSTCLLMASNGVGWRRMASDCV